MRRIMARLDRLEERQAKPEKQFKEIDGQRLFDNQDMCMMLNCSKRTLQRFRASGKLPCRRFDQKTYYLEPDVAQFIREHLKPPTGEAGK
jgi:hypothetical protein